MALPNIRASNEVKEAQRMERLKTFASAYVVMLKVTKTKREAKKAAGEVIGIKNDHTLNSYMKDPYVVAQVKNHLETVSKKYAKQADDVLDELSLIAYSDPAEYFEDHEEGIKLKKIFEMDPRARRNIKKIKHSQVIHSIPNGDNEPIKAVENSYEYEFYDKVKALQLLAQYHQLINRKAEGENNSNVEKIRFYLPHNGRNPVDNLIEDAEFTAIEQEKSGLL
jgi:hypothetical protein